MQGANGVLWGRASLPCQRKSQHCPASVSLLPSLGCFSGCRFRGEVAGASPFLEPPYPAGSARPPAMASQDGASSLGSSHEETELSITLTLRMLMHGKVTAGKLGSARGGQQCPGWGTVLEHQLLTRPWFLPLHSQKGFFLHPKLGRGRSHGPVSPGCQWPWGRACLFPYGQRRDATGRELPADGATLVSAFAGDRQHHWQGKIWGPGHHQPWASLDLTTCPIPLPAERRDC